MKDHIKKAIATGMSYDEIIDDINAEIVSQILVKARGNQTEAARLLKLNRGTFRKYLTKAEEV